MTHNRFKNTNKGLKVYYICRTVRTLNGQKTEILDAPSGQWYYKGSDLGFTYKSDAQEALNAYSKIHGPSTAFVKKLDDEQVMNALE